jgi:hypothetical protein
MIRFLLLQNRAGKTRLAKYYVPVSDSEKRKLEYDVHRLIVVRDPKHTNFVEVRALRWSHPPPRPIHDGARGSHDLACRHPGAQRCDLSWSHAIVTGAAVAAVPAPCTAMLTADQNSFRFAGPPPADDPGPLNPSIPHPSIPVQDIQGGLPAIRGTLLLDR